MSSLCQNPEIFICILYLVTICSDSASYFLAINILIILVSTLTQIRMGLGCITFPGIGPRRSQYAFLMSKLMHFQLLIIVWGFSASYFLEMVMPIRKVGTLTQTRMRIGSLIFVDMGFMRG